MLIGEIFLTLFWFGMALSALFVFAYWTRIRVNSPTAHFQRFRIKSSITANLWFIASLTVFSCWISFIPIFNLWILPPLYINSREEKRLKRFLETEILTLEGKKIPPAPSDWFSNGQSLAVESKTSLLWRMIIAFIFILICTGFLFHRLWPLLYPIENQVLGVIMTLMVLLVHAVVFGFNYKQLMRNDYPEISTEELIERYRSILNKRESQSNAFFNPLASSCFAVIVFIAVFGYSFYSFMKTPFVDGIIDCATTLNVNYYDVESRTLLMPSGSQINIAAWQGSRDYPWTVVFMPVGFACDDENCPFASELLRECVHLQTQDEPAKPYVEPILLGPDNLMIPFYTRPENRYDKHYLQKIVFENSLEETTFDAAKANVEEKFRSERAQPEKIATKYALVARHRVCDFGATQIALHDDLQSVTWPVFQEFYRERFSRYQPLLVFEVAEQKAGMTLDDWGRNRDILPHDAKVKLRRFQPIKPGEYRATWDLEYPATVVSWTLPDPKTQPDEHGGMILAVKAFERQLASISREQSPMEWVHSDLFVAPEGLVVFLSVVWKKGSNVEDNLRFLDERTSTIDATKSLPEWLKTERRTLAMSFVFLSFAPWSDYRSYFANSVSAVSQNCGTRLFQYEPFLDERTQYQNLSEKTALVNIWSVQRAAKKFLTKEKRIVVVLEGTSI